SFLTEPLILLVVSHLVAALLRLRRVNLPVAAVISLVVGVLATSLLLYQSTTRFGLPTATTADAVGRDLRNALELFRDVKAPAQVLPGFTVATAMTFWVVGFLGDWAAFRLDAAVEATIPAGGLFIFAALFGADVLRLQLTVVFAIACLVFILLHRSARQEVGMPWVRGDARRGSRAFVRAGTTLTALGVLLGLAAAPLLPGSGSEPLVDWKELGGRQGTRITVSPLVDIQSRLVDQRDSVAFEVRSNLRAYWRLTALDSFDGRLWRSDQRFTRVEDELRRSTPPPAAAQPLDQEFTIENLSQIWLPAAFEPRDIDAGDVEVRWEGSTSTLIVDEETSDGMTYNVASMVPTFDQAALAAAPSNVPDAIREQYLELPPDFSERARVLAATVALGATTPYEQAMRLQTFFRTQFEYSTEVQRGHGDDRLEQFLFETQVGYCEQFAGSFAAMARAIGLPARVAVGFTPGDADPNEPGRYIVRGRHAHAWPEVYIAGFGWVLFEPTPGRGAPDADYTGVPEAQDGAVIPPAGSDESLTTTTAPSSLGVSPDGLLPVDELGTGALVPEQGTPTSPPAEEGFLSRTRWVLPGLVGLVALYAAAVVGAKLARRAWRRRRAVTSRQRIDLAWKEAVESLGILGIRAEPSETPAEFAERVGARRRVDAGGLDRLAQLTTEARYAPTDAITTSVDQAHETATAVLVAVKDQTTRGQRLGYDLSPRSLLQRARRRGE
ncbi:MAG: DUF3488 domain-containing protein, partial [Acidimicrobiia bacterium]|nr:DUF3488 domain-containing protein [Acidimicrobiia bacterium]